MKWLLSSYWWLLLTGKKAPVKRGRPKGSKNKPKKRTRKTKAK
jgi:hypothetical protein|tara:strand:+ start:214 stop:342 length:129 start_codon:yes stop_codon:yes gene_type:complete